MINPASLVITGIGPDRPGLVAGLSALICEHGGNIQDSTMTRLAGQFAMILIASLPSQSDRAVFEQEADKLATQLGIRLHVGELSQEGEQALEDALPQSHRAYLVSVAGSDRTGITYHVSKLLASYEANITDLNAHRIDGEDGPVYVMVVEFDLPVVSRASQLETELSTLGAELGLDVRFRSIEAVAL